jgi:DNA-directed RNA polymerase I subunit RPA2
MIIKERLEEALSQVRNQIALDVRKEDPAVNFVDSKLSRCIIHIAFS